MGKYRILNDWGGYDGMKFHDDKEYDTVGEAVKAAVDSRYGASFLIVQIIDWEAITLTKKK